MKHLTYGNTAIIHQSKFTCPLPRVGWVLQVDRTPQSDEEALALAREHFFFYPYVLETEDSLGQYADYLKKQKIWHFWWD